MYIPCFNDGNGIAVLILVVTGITDDNVVFSHDCWPTVVWVVVMADVDWTLNASKIST